MEEFFRAFLFILEQLLTDNIECYYFSKKKSRKYLTNLFKSDIIIIEIIINDNYRRE